MDRRKGRAHPQPVTYHVKHPYQLLALYTLWDAVKNIDDPEERAWFNLNNPVFVFWCNCAGLEAQEVVDRAYTLFREASYTIDVCDNSTEEPISHRSLDTTVDTKRTVYPRTCRPQNSQLFKTVKGFSGHKVKNNTIHPKLAALVYLRDSRMCRYCGVAAVGIDHVVPGGEAVEENLVASCARCNNIKNDRLGFWLRYDPRLAERGNRFFRTNPYGQKGTLWYRNKIISPRCLFGDAVWNYVKQDLIGKKNGRRKYSRRRKRTRKE